MKQVLPCPTLLVGQPGTRDNPKTGAAPILRLPNA